MKIRSILLLIAVFMLSISFYAFAEEGENPKQVSITLYPIGLALGYYSFEAEYKLAPNLGLPLEVKYWSFDAGDDWNFSQLAIGPGLRYYPANKGMTGVFVGPYLNYVNASVEFKYIDDVTLKEETAKASGSGATLALWFGYKIITGPVVLEVSTGFGYAFVGDFEVEYTDGGVKKTETYSGTGASGFGWTGLGIGVGFAF